MIPGDYAYVTELMKFESNLIYVVRCKICYSKRLQKPPVPLSKRRIKDASMFKEKGANLVGSLVMKGKVNA